MILGRGTVIARFVEHLSEGDPVSLGILAVFVLFVVVVGLVVLKVKRDHKREDETRRKRRGY